MESLGRHIRGSLPNEPSEANPYGVSRPWWWLPTWSIGVFVAEAGILNLIVPVSAIGLPLFLVNMWACFALGGVAGEWTGQKKFYRLLYPELRSGINTRWHVVLPAIVIELAIGIGYFSVSNWVYVFTHCWTGNACTFLQMAPVWFLPLGAVGLAYLIVGVIRYQTSSSPAFHENARPFW